jgi:hypothetical protein
MKTVIAIVSAAVLVLALGFTVDAATKKATETAQQQKSCKAQAAKKYSVVHFLKRRAYVKRCMGDKA